MARRIATGVVLLARFVRPPVRVPASRGGKLVQFFLQRALCSLPASSDRRSVFLRPVAANWFSFFQYDFVAGRPFTQAEYDAGRAAFQEAEDEWRSYRSLEDGVTRRFVVITERLARQLFGSADRAVGGEMQMDFQPVRVVGVVSDVSSIFQTAYAEVWEPFTLLNETQNYNVRETGGLAGLRYAVIRRTSGASAASMPGWCMRSC